MPKQALTALLFLTIVSLFIYTTSAQAIQRMGLLSGGSARIPADGSDTLPAVCLDEHDEPPTTSSSYVNVLNASSANAVTVEIDGHTIPLQEALDKKLVGISGVSSPLGTEAYIDEVRVHNLSGKPISVRVNQPAVLDAGDRGAFNYNVTKLLKGGADQDEVWRQQALLASQPHEPTSPPESLATDRVARDTIRRRSTQEMRLFHFSAKGGESELVFADGTSVALTATELEMLKAGTPLPPTHALSARFSEESAIAHVLYSDPQLETSAAYVMERNSLAFGLQAAYPKANVYRDPLSDDTSARAQKLNEFKIAGAKNLLVVIPDNPGPDAQIQYVRTITNIREDLAKANVEIKQFKVGMLYDGERGRAVFVITGHSSEQLVTFVRQVGEAGFFRDNYVVLNSCGVGPATALASEINTKYGAVGTFSFQGEIRASAVQNYMLDLLERLKGSEAHKFVPLLIESSRSKGLFGIFTISKLIIGVKEA